MSYRFQPGKMYRMPTHFGPATGPRQGPAGRRFPCKDNPKAIVRSVSFLTRREQLEELLPEGFEVDGEPVVTVSANYMTEIEWLAGRGYNTLGVSFPATFRGEQDRASGHFLSVLWENLTDPILTGREELGFSKIYCELPEPTVLRGETHCTASWMGFRFMDMNLRNMTEIAVETPSAPPAPPSDDSPLTGTLHYKYIPKTGAWGEADAAYAVLTPAHTPNTVVTQMQHGEGTVVFHRARWEDMPTQYAIVNALCDLEIRAYRGASIVYTIGAKDLSDQRILR
ncbi:MAG: acetoacetate decarboxylase family protein [candidate division Zixibacteria bacterium]|nr:acetoacetate decarboxylase family protein [candidate division Zixibacteria bacterium]